MRIARWVAMAALAFQGVPAGARTVDYDRTEAELRTVAVDLGVADMPATPPRGSVDIAVENAESLDHRVLILAMSCSAWEVDNPLSRIVRRALEGWDRDAVLDVGPDRPQLTVRFEGARSTLRCVQVAELSERCLVRTTIDALATIARPGRAPRTERFSIDHQHIQTPSAACGGLANGTAVAGWTASVRLLERLRDLDSD